MSKGNDTAEIESNNNESVQSATLSMDVVTALSYIFEGTILHNNLRKIVSLHNKSIVPFKNLSNLIRRSFITNPFQIGQTMKCGILLSLPFNNPTDEQRSGRVLCNSNFADEICVDVRKCHYVTIVLGAVETTLKVTDCENVSISAVCHRLLISQFRSLSFHIHILTRPVIQLNCASLLFAPYHISHVDLAEQMERVGICKELNLWNKPLVTHPAGYVDEQPWSILLPDDFYLISSIRLEDQQTIKRR
ncbi:unnamed protein product [Rotaria sordida]|uniref:Tubulin binding cofactor C-like domain-containing protein n=1 Tax=Rotaria sordida TaxID=392033 RepID=A0A815HRU2_9BILA|nr:unnamed protein product [Rotaria sordida]CAF1605513.1 unnamed protein product [Rotaria sordida]